MRRPRRRGATSAARIDASRSGADGHRATHALAAVLGFASGIRLYAVLLVVGLVGYAGWVDLPTGLDVLSHPWVLAAPG